MYSQYQNDHRGSQNQGRRPSGGRAKDQGQRPRKEKSNNYGSLEVDLHKYGAKA